MKQATVKSLCAFWLPLAAAGALWSAFGQSEKIDPKKLAAAAERGDAEAEFRLARAYEFGNGVPADPKKALEYYRESAERGNAKAQNNLASIYASGSYGVARDDAKAKGWLRKAAGQGAALAQDNLGITLLKEGDKEAVQWFEKAAGQGLLSAQLHLADLYYQGGAGIAQDYGQAAKWLRQAATQNSAPAQNTLGVIYQYGFGAKLDFTEAAKWYRRAAEQGYAKAQSNLGQLYCAGRGVPADPAEGYKWLYLSAEQEEITALKFMVDFRTGMTPEQIAAGERLVAEYKKTHDLPEAGKSPQTTPGTSPKPDGSLTGR